MQITVQEQVKEHPEFTSGIERANQVMEKEIGSSQFSDDVRAEWTLVENGANGKEIQLTMSDSLSSSSFPFSARDLSDDNRVLPRIRRLWGDLLQIRTDTHRNRFNRLVAQLIAEEED